MNRNVEIWVALDVDTSRKARALVRQLAPYADGFKIGLEYINNQDARKLAKYIHSKGKKVFFDGKFKDIPNTVAGAATGVAEQGVAMFNIHASGGRKMMEEAVKNKGDSLILAVTVLTSMDDEACRENYGGDVKPTVLRFAKMAVESGCDGLVCSAQDLQFLRKDQELWRELEGKKKVIPAIRPLWAVANDQKRPTTPGDAVHLGADVLIIGRPIIDPPKEVGSPVDAIQLIREEVDEALAA